MNRHMRLLIGFCVCSGILAGTIAPQSVAAAETPTLEQLQTLVAQDLQARNYPYHIAANVPYQDEIAITDDFNQDGLMDIAGVFCPFADDPEDIQGDVRNEGRFLAIGLGTGDGRLTLVLNAQGLTCLDCGSGYGVPDITLQSEDGVITLSEHGGGRHRWTYTQHIRYEQGQFRVIGYEAATFNVTTLDDFGYALNFETLEGRRSYSSGKTVADPVTVRFKNFIALPRTKNIQIDGILDEPDWQQTHTVAITEKSALVQTPDQWNGPHDLSFSAATVWDADALYLAVTVTDEALVSVDAPVNLLQSDHLELWFDFDDTVAVWTQDEKPRQHPDAAVAQLGIGLPAAGATPEVQVLWPEKASVNGIVAAITNTSTGYQFEVKIPFAALQQFAPKSFAWHTGAEFGFSVAVSDTDDLTQRGQDCLLATSELTWGNPYTFGACYLVETYQPPAFPLKEWKSRY